MNNKKEILDGVQTQISNFDTKASILLSVVGIIFALTLSFLDVFHNEFYFIQSQSYKVCYSILFVSYIVITIALIISLILVIIPRKHATDKKYPNYYKDIVKFSNEELKSAINEYNKDDEIIIEQIKINSSICIHKHNCLKVGAIMLIPFIFCIVVMILMIMFA